MKKSILAVLGVILFIIICVEFCVYKIGKRYLTDKENLEQIRCLLKNGELKDGYIANLNKPFISINNQSFLTSNYVYGMGLIPRWTQMSKEIDQWVEEKQRIKDSTDKANIQKEIDNICN